MSEVVEKRVELWHAAAPADPAGGTAARNARVDTSPRRIGAWAALSAAVAFTQTACSGGDGTPEAAGVGAKDSPVADPDASTQQAKQGSVSADPAAAKQTSISVEQAARFLLHAQFAASERDIADVRASGIAGWLSNQYAASPSQSGWDWLESRGYGQVDANRFYNASYPADYMVWHQLFAAPDQMRQRMAFALSQFFVVSTTGITTRWKGHMMAAYWDLLTAHAFGNFRDLLEAVTLNAAMGVYLNMRGNQKEDPAKGRLPDENYAREIMQLMSIGLYRLNKDGTEKTAANGAKIETYGQNDVTNLARVFTGWDFDQSGNSTTPEAGSGTPIGNTAFARLPMVLNAARHSGLASTFLGVTIAAGTDGKAALKSALDTLFNHPNVGPFFARQMIQRLVMSNPSRSYVAHVAAAFNDNGQGQRGDLRAVWTAILTDPQALTNADNTLGKLREPVQRFVQWGRSFGLNSTLGSWKIGDASDPASRLGQSPLRSPSVFNFFRPGYVPPSTALAATGTTAPEFQLVSESSVGGYLNYMQTVIRRGLYVSAADQPGPGSNATNGYDVVLDYTAELALVGDAKALVAHLDLKLAAGQLSDATCQLMSDALNAVPITAASSANAKLDRVAAAVLMVMACSEYLVQK